VPDWDNTESRESDEDAAWRDLVARFEEPTTTSGPVPWPEREDVPRPQATRGADGTDGTPGVHGSGGVSGTQGGLGAGETQSPAGTGGQRGAEGSQGPDGAHGIDGIRGFDDEGVRGAFGADGKLGTDGKLGADGGPGAYEPDVIQAARRERRAAAHGTRARRIRARKAPQQPVPENDQEHFIPPAPPPLPKLDPIAKGAWAALFGGPGYLVIATAVGWSVPGIAAFCAVAAFITGFAILVLRMNEPGPGGPDDGDDGAVV
jgi:hypothetical protein